MSAHISAPAPRPSRLSYLGASAIFVIIALAALAIADIKIIALHPGQELQRMLAGLLGPDILSIEVRSVVNTVSFAVLGVSLGASAGIVLALGYARSALIRSGCAFLRSVHELFWALLLMQVTGLSPLTGILAIAIPYAGIFAKVLSEMIEEADLSAAHVLPPGTSTVSAFSYARLPEIAGQFKSYTLYRLECGLRSTLVLGFIGLPTIGFHLESYFKQGYYAQAAALLFIFYILIGTRRLWARPVLIPLLIVGSLLMLPEAIGGGSILANLQRFFFHDIVPAPLRAGDPAAASTWFNFVKWLWQITRFQIVPGIIQTLVLSQIAVVAMGVLALGLFPLICRRFAGKFGRPLGRVLLVLVRSTPEYMLAYVLLQLLGPSMLPAIIALSLHNGAIVGYLMGCHADALEHRADAPKGINLYFYEVLPRLYGQFLAYILYRWEIILRESSIFGMLGVMTLGFYFDAAISEIKLDVAMVLILATAALSMSVDALSRTLRKNLRIETLPVRLASLPGALPNAASKGDALCRR